MSVHYVAHLKVEKVTKPEPSNTGSYQKDSVKGEREIDEVTQMVIKASDLEELMVKLQKHIEIIED